MAEEVTYWMAVRRTCVRVWGKVWSAFIDHNIWGGNILSVWALSRLWSSQANDISLPKIKGGTFLDDRQISVWALNFEATYERRQHIRGGNILGVWGGCEAQKRRRPTGANPSYLLLSHMRRITPMCGITSETLQILKFGKYWQAFR